MVGRGYEWVNGVRNASVIYGVYEYVKVIYTIYVNMKIIGWCCESVNGVYEMLA